jgi:hypothetical protein
MPIPPAREMMGKTVAPVPGLTAMKRWCARWSSYPWRKPHDAPAPRLLNKPL